MMSVNDVNKKNYFLEKNRWPKWKQQSRKPKQRTERWSKCSLKKLQLFKLNSQSKEMESDFLIEVYNLIQEIKYFNSKNI